MTMQNLKRKNFELNQLLERRNFEVQELEYEKNILERKTNYFQDKLKGGKNTLSNKKALGKGNDKLFLSSLQILLNQGLRELNILKKNNNFDNESLKLRHLENAQRVFNVLKEKFNGEGTCRMINANGDLLQEMDEIISLEEQGMNSIEQLRQFREILID